MVIVMNVNYIFKYPVEAVVHTHLTKYPTEKEKNVLSVDTVENRTEGNGVVYLKRIATCLNVVPTVMRKVSGMKVNTVHIQEECWFDRQRRFMRLQSRNLTWASHASLCEESTFEPLSNNPHWTWFEQKGTIEVRGIGPFGRIVELFAHCFLQSGVQKSFRVMEELLRERHNAKKLPMASVA